MALLSLSNVSFGFGGRRLLENVTVQIEPRERICLLGRNGEGKSTLLRLLAGELAPEDGEVTAAPGVRVARLAQDVPTEEQGTVYDVVLGDQAALLHDEEGWRIQQRVEQVLSRMSLDPESKFEALSAGMKRRVLLGRSLALAPDILLLDEPTNHLDIEAITWIEDFLLDFAGTLVFVTHDRMFLRKLATRIIEIDRARLFDWPCDYETFLKRKADALDAEAQQWELFDRKLAAEEVWIRQGIKARRTRNEGRVRALEALRKIRSERRERTGNVRMQLQEAERSGSLVIETKDVEGGYGDRIVIRDLTTTVMRGDRLGIIGPNGSGKTTLLQLLLGRLAPLRGKVRHGTNLEICYFDQLRAQLNEEQTVQQNVAEGNDTVLINGQSRHVVGYLQDFLFTPERARNLVKYLSGGERNRLLLAKLFTKPSNVLVLDEPTNDLDAETLELLGELLADYPGTVLLVSHDRAFLNEVVTSTLVIGEEGRVHEYAGGYDDWLLQRPAPAPAPSEVKPTPPKPRPVRAARPKKLTFKEERALESLPGQIETLEAEQEELQQKIADPAFYRQDRSAIAAVMERMDALKHELAAAYELWESLELRK